MNLTAPESPITYFTSIALCDVENGPALGYVRYLKNLTSEPTKPDALDEAIFQSLLPMFRHARLGPTGRAYNADHLLSFCNRTGNVGGHELTVAVYEGNFNDRHNVPDVWKIPVNIKMFNGPAPILTVLNIKDFDPIFKLSHSLIDGGGGEFPRGLVVEGGGGGFPRGNA